MDLVLSILVFIINYLRGEIALQEVDSVRRSRKLEWFAVIFALLLLSSIAIVFYLYSRNRIAEIEFQLSVYKELARNKVHYRDILERISSLEDLLEGNEPLDAASLSRIENRVALSENRLRNLLNQLNGRMNDLETLVWTRDRSKYDLASEYAELGELSDKSGYHSEATGFYRESLQYEQTEEALMSYARSMYMASSDVRDDSDILKALDAILVRSPYNQEALQLRGRLYLEQGHKDLALESYEVLAALAPESFQIQRDTARLALSEGRFDKALVCYERALSLEYEESSLHYELGEVWKLLGEVDKAESSWRRALEIDPSFTAPALSLAEVLVAKGRYEEAEEFVNFYIQIRGDDYKGHLLLGDIHHQNEQFLEAELSWKKAQNVLVLNSEVDISLWVDASLRIARLFKERGEAGRALEYSLAALAYEERAELLDIAIWSSEKLGDEDALSTYRRRREKLSLGS